IGRHVREVLAGRTVGGEAISEHDHLGYLAAIDSSIGAEGAVTETGDYTRSNQAANADVEGVVGRHVREDWRALRRVYWAHRDPVRLLVLVALAVSNFKGELVAQLVGVGRPVVAEVAHDYCIHIR